MDERLEQIFRNTFTFEQELAWFSKVLETRMQLYFGQDCEVENISEIAPPNLEGHQSNYAELVQHYQMSPEERLLLMLALVPNLKPQTLDIFFTKNSTYDRSFTEFGGWQDSNRTGFHPTGETALFLLAGNHIGQRIFFTQFLQGSHYFFKHGILTLTDSESEKNGELHHALFITPEYLHVLTSGQSYQPEYSASFPAKLLTTALEWDDLVLTDYIKKEVNEIRHWIEYQRVILQDWNLGKQLKPGYRSLFYGPPGTGKTLTASLLGKVTGLQVFRVDLSQIASKYIGETEKNLGHVFDQAAHKNWILFFDEADALFGKRTSTADAQDRYANQEIAYLLQKMEDFPGVIILATNLKMNMDKAFARRFQSIIHFPMPDAEARLELWTRAFAPLKDILQEVDFKKLAQDFELSGGFINNILRFASLRAVQANPPSIRMEDLLEGVRREFAKEGKTV